MYTKSAEQGNSLAMCGVQVFATTIWTRICDQNQTKAFEWQEKSAKLGCSVAMSMFNVGVYYENGEGVTNDVNKAREWFAKAVAQGFEMAQDALDDIIVAHQQEENNDDDEL